MAAFHQRLSSAFAGSGEGGGDDGKVRRLSPGGCPLASVVMAAQLCVHQQHGWTVGCPAASGAAGLPAEGRTRCSGAVGFESTRSRLWTVHSPCFSGRRRPRDSSPGPPRNGVEPDSQDSQVSGPAPRQSPTPSGCEFMNGATSWKRTGVFAPPSPLPPAEPVCQRETLLQAGFYRTHLLIFSI